VLAILEENHSQPQVLDSMTYLSSLAAQYGQTTSYHGVRHPSLPNYLAIAGGDTFGVTDDNPPSSHPVAGDSVFDQTIAAGGTAGIYAEAMPGNCALTSSGDYAVKHNPWAYFNGATQRANCQKYDVPLGTTVGGNLITDIDAGTLPDTGMIVPDLCNDAHDCSLTTADAWLSHWIPTIMAGPDYLSGDLTIIVTFDEDDSATGNLIAFVVIDPSLLGKHVSVPLTTNHYSLTRWYETAASTKYLRNAATAPDLQAAFGL
jgi:acid phosphatase